MKKVCIIGQFPPPMHGLSKALDTLYNGLKEEFDFEKVDIKDNKKFLLNLLKILKSKADVFYFTISQTVGGNKRDLLILKLLSLKKKKVIVHLHGGYYRTLVENDMSSRQRKANYKAMAKVDKAIVLSPSLQYIFEGMLPTENILVVENCIDNEFLLSDADLEEKTTVKKDGFNVLYLSNFNKEKGYRNVLSLALKEKENRKVGKAIFSFHFAGAFFDETEKNFFFDYIEKNNLQDIVIYHGVVGGEEKKKLLKESDIFILLTRYPKEGQPISILEAMGNGLAVVSCNHAAIGDTVTDGKNGILCLSGEETQSKELYQRMKTMSLNLPDIAKENRSVIVNNYTQEQYLQKLKEIFETV